MVFGLWVNGVRKIAPVDQVVADGMSPVYPVLSGGAGLLEQVPTVLPVAKSVGIPHPPLGIDEMVDGAMGI